MLQFTRWKTIATLAVCLLGILLTIPNFMTQARYDALPKFAQNKFGLGLDLRGGAHFLTSMDVESLRKDLLLNLQDDVRKRLRDAKLIFTPPGIQAGGVVVKFPTAADITAGLAALKPMIQTIGSPLTGATAPDLDIKAAGPDTVSVTPTEAALTDRATQAIGTAIEVIRKRLDQIGRAHV